MSGLERSNGLVIDSSNIHVASWYNSLSVDFDPGAGTNTKAGETNGDMAVSTFKLDGSYVATLTVNGDTYDEIYSIAIDNNDSLYLTGQTASTVIDFNPYSGTDSQTPSGFGDTFLTKLSGTIYQFVTGLPAGLKLVEPSSGNEASDPNEGVQRSSSASLRLSTTGDVPIADATVNLVSDLDWSSVSGSSDTADFKSVVAGLNAGANGVVGSHSLYVPKRASDNAVFICPSTLTLNEVSKACSGVLSYSEAADNVSVVTIGGQAYWLVSGLTGSGGISGTASLANTGSNTSLLAMLAGGMVLGGAGLLVVMLRREK